MYEYYAWGNADEFALDGGRIPSHPCSREEIGLDRGPSTKMFPIKPSSINEVTKYLPNFICMDEGHPVLWGNYDTARAQLLSLKFRMC